MRKTGAFTQPETPEHLRFHHRRRSSSLTRAPANASSYASMAGRDELANGGAVQIITMKDVT